MNSIPPNLKHLSLKGKSKSGYSAMAFIFSLPIVLAINRILISQSVINTHYVHVIILSLGSFLIFSLLAYYFWFTLKEKKDYREIIKPERNEYFIKGIISAFISFNIFLVALVVSYTVGSKIVHDCVVYSALGINSVLGLMASIGITMYEFCSAFDIFYDKNKEEIIRAYLENQNKFKINSETRDES